MIHEPSRARFAPAGEPVLAAALALLLYGFTCAPDILWGDPAKLTLYVWHFNPSLDQGAHLGALVWAWPFSFLPLEPFALRITLASVAASSLTVGLLHSTLLRTVRHPWSARTGTAVFAVSHTFWFISTMAESYAAAVLAIMLAARLLVIGRKTLTAGIIAGAGSLASTLVIFGLPAALFWLWQCERRIAPALKLFTGVIIGAGIPVLLLTVFPGVESGPAARRWMQVLQRYTDPSFPAKNLPLLAAFFLYNFAGPSTFLAASGFRSLDRQTKASVIIFIMAHFAFALFYLSQRAYLIPLPVYLAASVLAAFGADQWLREKSRKTAIAIFSGCILVPVTVYAAAPLVLRNIPLPRVIRDAPFRDERNFYFRPWKSGEDSARRYIRILDRKLPENSAVFGDFTILMPLLYANRAENWKSGILWESVGHSGPDRVLERVSSHLAAGRRVFLLDDEPFYYPEKIRARWEIVSTGAESLYEVKKPATRTAPPPTGPGDP